MLRLNATCIEIDGSAALLRGPSGSGKSDLALRLISGGARLVADDHTDLRAADGQLIASAPLPIRHLIEVRGLGILRLTEDERLDRAAVVVLIDLVEAEAVPRMPEASSETLLGVAVPRFWLTPFEASAADKVRLAVRLATGRIMTVS